jgi:hypothetical protein
MFYKKSNLCKRSLAVNSGVMALLLAVAVGVRAAAVRAAAVRAAAVRAGILNFYDSAQWEVSNKEVGNLDSFHLDTDYVLSVWLQGLHQ